MSTVPLRIPPVTPGEINLAALPTLLQTQSPTILEVGCHNGCHTNDFLRLFAAGRVFAFEPDRRAQQAFRQNVTDPRAVLFHVAIGDHDGFAKFYPSSGQNPVFNNLPQADWDHSGSIRKPTGHLLQHPWCEFPETKSVRIKTLDSVCQELGIETVDFLWADVQGAEADLIRGGSITLQRTRYIQIEYSDVELYEGQPSLAALLAMLPTFQVLVRWKYDILLWNSSYPPPPVTISGCAAHNVAASPRPPAPPYVLARSCAGFNDTLCELEKCLRYCEAVDRHLIVDTTCKGIFEHLDVYLTPLSPLPMTLRCTQDDLRRLNTFASIPSVISGRLESYESDYSATLRRWVETVTNEPITFDFSVRHASPLLVHQQPWKGPLLSPAFLARCRFTDDVAAEILRRLKGVPTRDYVAVHVRNTDYSTNYAEFFEIIRPQLAGNAVLICTDDSRVFDHATQLLPDSHVFRLSTFRNEGGRPLHKRRHANQHEMNIQMLTDLMALALSRRILSADVREIPRKSGFTLLAMALQEQPQIVEGLLQGSR